MKQKHLVFVLQITVPVEFAEFVHSTLQNWAVGVRSAYTAVIRIDEVHVDD